MAVLDPASTAREDTRSAGTGNDFGRVSQGAALPSGEADTVFLGGGLDEALRSPATEGAFDVLSGLVPWLAGRVWVICKCGDRVQRRTLAWLEHATSTAEPVS
jgi:hypothetical protein